MRSTLLLLWWSWSWSWLRSGECSSCSTTSIRRVSSRMKRRNGGLVRTGCGNYVGNIVTRGGDGFQAGLVLGSLGFRFRLFGTLIAQRATETGANQAHSRPGQVIVWAASAPPLAALGRMCLQRSQTDHCAGKAGLAWQPATARSLVAELEFKNRSLQINPFLEISNSAVEAAIMMCALPGY